jgi:hypothetical protein
LASSNTIAIDLVPAGAPAQVSGGDMVRAPPQVNWPGIVLCEYTSLVTVITLGDVTVTPVEKSPQPASGTAQQAAAAARAARRARPWRRPDLESASHLTRPILGPATGSGGRYATSGRHLARGRALSRGGLRYWCGGG